MASGDDVRRFERASIGVRDRALLQDSPRRRSARVLIPYAPLHQLEVPNAFEMLVGRGAITRDECHTLLKQLREDIDARRLMTVSPDLDQVLVRASERSALYTAKTLARSLDLLHVVAAHVTSCTRLVSGDDRQLAVAKASGLEVVDIKRRPQRTR